MSLSDFITNFKQGLNSTNHNMNIQEITVEELKEKIDNNDEFLLLDVREPFEYKVSNLGGKLIPLGELMNHLDELEEYKDREVIVHCRTGGRSARACQILQANGFQNPKNLVGGINLWARVIDPSLQVY